MYESYEHLKFQRRGPVLTVAISNPPVNAISAAMHAELARIFVDVDRDSECHILVLTGEGKHFSGGGSLEQMLLNLDHPDHTAREMREAPTIARSLLGMSKPTIGKLNGHAIGLGASLALFCDIVFAAETARIGDPHVLVGLSAGDGGAMIWPHLIGYPRARHHLFTGEPLTAKEAEAAGLIYCAVPAEALDETVDAYADKLAAKSQQALSATKVSINMPLCRQANADATAQIGLETLTMIAPDHREALLALMEKREPRFTHGRL
jgi:enoyl-CoA hydratase